MTDKAKLDEIRGVVDAFAKRCHAELGVPAVYLFGSLIYRDGERFTEEFSDVDLAVVMPVGTTNPVGRATFTMQLLPMKIELERELTATLSRPTTVTVCSLMVVTQREVGADIHKDGAEGFFANNEFLEVLSDTRYHGFPGAAGKPVTDRLMRQCYRFVQKKRHAYLGVAANKRGALEPFSGEAPLPKDLLRHLAMASALGETVLPGAEYDTQEGLALILNFLTSNSDKRPEYRTLKEWMMDHISNRNRTLDANQQLLLAEIVWSFAEIALTNTEEAKRKLSDPPRVESTVFFYDRVGEAFPGKRGIYWATTPDDVDMRLKRLLGGELKVGRQAPIWMFRGHRTMPIGRFDQLDPGTYLFDHFEVKVARIALSQSELYYQSFVYVEGVPLAPTGVDPRSIEMAKEALAAGRVATEEYGLTNDGMLVTREEYDDGAAERGGTIVDTSGRTSLRCRYVTPVNFILCGQMAPLNNKKFDAYAGEILDRMLKGEDLLETLTAEMARLPRREVDDD
jgi:predicted nucleotidyltransferase